MLTHERNHLLLGQVLSKIALVGRAACAHSRIDEYCPATLATDEFELSTLVTPPLYQCPALWTHVTEFGLEDIPTFATFYATTQRGSHVFGHVYVISF